MPSQALNTQTSPNGWRVVPAHAQKPRWERGWRGGGTRPPLSSCHPQGWRVSASKPRVSYLGANYTVVLATNEAENGRRGSFRFYWRGRRHETFPGYLFWRFSRLGSGQQSDTLTSMWTNSIWVGLWAQQGKEDVHCPSFIFFERATQFLPNFSEYLIWFVN